MITRKRVACFFTCGYSELNAMKSFIKKVNDRVELIQLCPIGERRSKSQILGRHSEDIRKNQSGLTGAALVDFVLDFVKKKRFLDEGYDAILIEDDKDKQFLSLLPTGVASIDNDGWARYKQNIIDAVRKAGVDIPVIIIMAAPEIEAWFLSDWDNSFGKVYADDFSREQNEYFSVTFRRYINQSILTEQYKDSIEAYGYFEGEYRKLSAEIQKVLDEVDMLATFKPNEEHFTPRYSKRVQGEAMLKAVEPNQVMRHCTVFLGGGLLELQSLA